MLNDQWLIGDELSRHLLSSGHLAEVVCREEQAIKLLESGRKIDHVVADLRLGTGKSPIEFIVRELQPRGIPFTLVSACPEWNNELMWKPLGYEPKILDANALGDILKAVETRHNVTR